mmetsp:Transcript_70940/g.132691  ORF Transcript_70940/g.132691 Transcript_70940/m.132691 type:complete len:129 (+) Transcript_70940:66-452(+)
MFWKLTAFFILPLGMFLWALLLTGIGALEKIADAVCGVSMAVGPMHFTPPFLFVAVSVLSFAYESYELMNAGPKPGDGIISHDKELMGKWRHERNWWIILFNLVVWLTVWRLGSLLRGLRTKVEGKVK